jgi:hypothetical protein
MRVIHLYIGVFTAPALLFFAFTGALQTFSLHETTRGSSYKPPAWAVMLGQIHKKQTPVVPVRKAAPPDKLAEKLVPDQAAGEKLQSPRAATQQAQSAEPKPAPDAAVPKPYNALPLKLFFLLVAIGLFISTLSGMYMSYKYIRNKKLITGLLLAGVIVPVLLTVF